MAKSSGKGLSAGARKKIAPKNFGLPAQRKYPVEDKAHAANALARAAQQLHKGNLTHEQYMQIVHKANHKLHPGGEPMHHDN